MGAMDPHGCSGKEERRERVMDPTQQGLCFSVFVH